MIYKDTYEVDGMKTIVYQASYSSSYLWMLCAAQILISLDFKKNTQRIAAGMIGKEETGYMSQVKKADWNVFGCTDLLVENDVLIVAGISEISKIPLQITFYRNSNKVTVASPFIKQFEVNGEHMLDQYMDRLEIMAHVEVKKREWS